MRNSYEEMVEGRESKFCVVLKQAGDPADVGRSRISRRRSLRQIFPCACGADDYGHHTLIARNTSKISDSVRIRLERLAQSMMAFTISGELGRPRASR